MASLPPAVADLIGALSRLPGIGPRSAERLALHLVQTDPTVVQELAHALVAARERVRACSVCGALTEADPCTICTSPQRDLTAICVVERAVDILTLEKANSFRGRYHVLGGRISPTNGVGPEDLRIEALEARLATLPVREVILALGTDVEGDATSYYLAQRLAAHGVQVTRLAYGLPAGSGLEFADELTLSRALTGRTQVK